MITHTDELFTKYSNTYIINILRTNENNPRVKYFNGIVNTFNMTFTTLLTTQNIAANIQKVKNTLYLVACIINQPSLYLCIIYKATP